MSYRALGLQVVSPSGILVSEATKAEDALRIAIALDIAIGMSLKDLAAFVDQEESLYAFIHKFGQKPSLDQGDVTSTNIHRSCPHND